MEKSLRTSIRNGLFGWMIMFFVSLSFGVYDLFSGYEELNIINIILTIVGAILTTTIFFLLVFVISLIYFYFKEK